jgi:hypothetical protein
MRGSSGSIGCPSYMCGGNVVGDCPTNSICCPGGAINTFYCHPLPAAALTASGTTDSDEGLYNCPAVP